jgi:hypothetical protein
MVLGNRRSGQPDILGRQRETAPFHDPDECPHGVKPVHPLPSIVRINGTVLPNIA